MLVERRVECVFSSVVRVFVRCVVAAWRSLGRDSVAEFSSVCAIFASEEIGGTDDGEAIMQR
jgi:hypothetical protein